MECTKYSAPSLQIQILPNTIFIIPMGHLISEYAASTGGGGGSFMKQINVTWKLHTHTQPNEIFEPY